MKGNGPEVHGDDVAPGVGAESSAWLWFRTTSVIVVRRFGWLLEVPVYKLGGEELVSSWLEMIGVEPDAGCVAFPLVGWGDPEEGLVSSSIPRTGKRLRSEILRCSKSHKP